MSSQSLVTSAADRATAAITAFPVPCCFRRRMANGARLILGDQEQTLPLNAPSIHGLSYLHIQTLASEKDKAGVYVRSFHACGNPDVR